MRCTVSVPDTALISHALSAGAEIIEVRLDLCGQIPEQHAKEVFSDIPVPLIFTLRSAGEGGLFQGGPGEWWEILQPYLSYATFIDVEERFASFAPRLKEIGKTVISSYHTPSMPDPPALAVREERLRSFGDIPKIVVGPRSEDDVLALLSFTRQARKPVITSTMGTGFRYARLLLPLFGSYLIFCHCGTAASPGQYHVREWKEFCRLVRDPRQPG
ncbi:MAG: 3-dehydroquinate dehydratase [Methanoregulaceae archaeon PtaB.Bin056]|nr:MAG: 3-dehydroquinate dehydratase [Methanoregulaceae archaeon PtaB.Bin056]